MSTSSGFSQVSSLKSPENLGFLPAGAMLVSGEDLNLGFSANLRRRNGSAPELFHRPEKMANLKSLDLFPQEAGFGISNDVVSSVYKSATAAPQASQMTIFYAGQVFVFNNFPAERVGEVMFLAGRESSKLNIPAATVASGQPILVGTPADSLSSSSPVSTRTPTPPPPPQPQSVTGALPMARKASIQRFLEKRRDRLTLRAPYQNYPAPSKLAGDNSWLGLAVQP
ncbi:protein TIFY 10a-like [Cucurbita pepo subsp. pepo]|uniref:protein TIFY 10a-like n=1 Tax=Cucurbita pepo subsp. pepo TaxID=3664 RepID=UPI000C9D483A|nr:protein TIFY 10a-like [Cucurbita pepo subsp. pepo]